MTLGGLFLAIGPLVDNAIVVLENTHRHLGMGKTPSQAAADATGELTLPVLVATLALIIVLCPVALTPGRGRVPVQAADAGRRVRDDRLVHPVVDVRPGAVLEDAHGPRSRPRHTTTRAVTPVTAARRASSPALYGRISAAIDCVGRGYAALLDGRAAAPVRGAGRHRRAVRRVARAGAVHRPGVLPGGGCRADHDPGPRPVEPAARRDRAADRRRRGGDRRGDPAARTADGRLRDRAEQRLVGRLHGERRPAGHGHPRATHAGADASRPRSTPSCCGSGSPPTRGSPTWSSASTPAAWCRRR